jgi:hypothetical protein
MESSGSGGRAGRQVMRVLGVVVVGVFGGIFLMLLPDFLLATPVEIQNVVRHPLLWIGLAIVPLCLGAEPLAAILPMRWIQEAARVVEWAKGWGRRVSGTGPAAAAVAAFHSARMQAVCRRVDLLAERLLGPMSAAVGAVCILFLLTWAPHYLTWPAWADTDQFMVSAQSWDAGLRPYRDLPDFDFPGPILLLYVLGKAFGWGQTLPFYAVDLALLLVLGGALVAWSRRMFGAAMPGLIGYLPFLAYYLGLDYSQVAQRDWQGPALVVLGLLALEAVPGRAGRFLSAAGFAAALSIRPQVVLFGPAILSAVDESARRQGEPVARSLRALAGWSAALAVSLLAVFYPLIAAGVLDDFVRVLSVAQYGGSYNQTSWFSFATQFKLPFIAHSPTNWWTWALILAAVTGPSGLRRPARTWALALIGAFLYKPLSPVPHEYLIQPLRLMQSVALAPLAGWVFATPRLVPSMRFAGLALLIYSAAPGLPRYCTARGSLQALGPLARGEIPERPPPGCRNYFPPPESGHYDSWDDYRHLLTYLRRDTDRHRPVANLLRVLPFPAVNGPTRRLTPFPAAGGFLYLSLVSPAQEDRFAEALDRHPDSLVVWTPDDKLMDDSLKFPKIEAVIRRRYHPLVRFGHIHVWGRSDDASGSEAPAASAGAH